MKFGKFTLSVTFLGFNVFNVLLVTAFPTLDDVARIMTAPNEGLENHCPFADIKAGIEKAIHKRSLLNPLSSPIDVSGEHAFQAPDFSSGDQRGPCPGLNALANHGYIPRNGVVTIDEVISGINEVWGMGLDLSTILATLGTVFVGDILSINAGFSIGGYTPAVSNILGNGLGLLGTPRGLIGSHNIIEADSSNTRDDLYVTGNNYAMNLDKFKEWYKMADENGTFSEEAMALRAKIRFDESIATNPNFYYGPFTGMIARNAGYIFANRFFRNYSSEHPEGILTKDIVKSIFAVSGDDDNLIYNEGWERIPENWYRMPVDYNLLELNLDIVALGLQYPELLSIGGNTGSVNSFAGIDLGNLTGGLLNVADLLEGNNLLCFVMEIVKTVSPNLLSGIWATLDKPLEIITDAIGLPLLNLSCPAFKDLSVGGQPVWTALLNDFPGALKANSAL